MPRATGRPRLKAFPVEVPHVQRGGVDLVQAAGIDRHHRSIRSLPARERAHAADLAEEVMDVLPLELIVRQRVIAFLQRERARRHEREERAGARADRAVALGDGLGEIDVDAVADRAAMAATGMGLEHGSSSGRRYPIALGSIQSTSQWCPSRSWKLRPYMKPGSCGSAA